MSGCILVFGMPRSGTTWVGKLFDSHPDTLYRHEPDSVRRLRMPLYPDATSVQRYRHELEQFVASLPRMRSPEVVGKLPLFAKNYQSRAGLAAYRASVIAAKAASRVKRNFPCPYRPMANGNPRTRVVWKSIESPGRLGACMAALPDARAIHLMRHPCGYVASQLRGAATNRFSNPVADADNPWILKLLLASSAGKGHELTLDDARRLTPEERLAWRWVLTQEKILADVAHNRRVLTMRYEDVCAEPFTMTRKMFEFAGLDWQAQTGAFVRASSETVRRAADTDYYSVFKPSQGAAERWRIELAPDVIERVMRILRMSSLFRYYPEDANASTVAQEVEI
ncbi:MAG TPA: sulfotransferase [Rhodanobacteraceae bacterium]|nr:sulfotransferase [Rhodanobacteraceae bacterium]